MHPQIYVQRVAVAQNKLAEQAGAVAVKFGIEPPNLTPMAVIAREPELLRLFELESVVDFLERLASTSSATRGEPVEPTSKSAPELAEGKPKKN